MEKQHIINAVNRDEIEITGVVEVNSYNEEELDITTDCGNLLVTGTDFNVKKLDVESGVMCVKGKLDSIYYTDNDSTQNKTFLKRFFKQ